MTRSTAVLLTLAAALLCCSLPAAAQSPNCGDPPFMMVVLDRSGSMSGSKWSSAKTAVTNLVTKYDIQINFGLMVFPGPSGSCSAGQVDVPIANTSKNAIIAMLGKTSTTGLTPMGVSMKNAYNYLKGLNPKKKKYIMLITDGTETCSGKAIDWVNAAKGAGIKTFVVGFGSGVNKTELENMALAGGTPKSGSPKYYQADSPASLSAALQAIGSLVSCCGNGVLDAGEKCDKSIPVGKKGACPKKCDDKNPCTTDAPTGKDCAVSCKYTPVTKPKNGDGCCPPGANSTNDTDCKASCGNGVLEKGEGCDPGIKAGAGKCKTKADCDDKNVCTVDALVGSKCSVKCTNTAVKANPNAKDKCCPPGLSSVDDADCPQPCGPDTTKNCVNTCKGVKCPAGFYCQYGKCLPKTTSKDGGTTPPGTEAGTPPGTEAGVTKRTEAGVVIGPDGGNNNNGGGEGFVDGEGCACSVDGSAAPTGSGLLLLLALLISRRRRE